MKVEREVRSKRRRSESNAAKNSVNSHRFSAPIPISEKAKSGYVLVIVDIGLDFMFNM